VLADPASPDHDDAVDILGADFDPTLYHRVQRTSITSEEDR
jgi:hypothetical protein